MTTTLHSIVERPAERGSALVSVLLLLMLMSALVAALGVSGQTETQLSRNQRSGAQAQAAAEAGLNHAVELATRYIFEWRANGILDGADVDIDGINEAIQALLKGPDGVTGTEEDDADNGSLGVRTGIDATEALPKGTRVEIDGAPGVEYEAFLMDDEETPVVGALAEDGDPFNDVNQRLIVRATGYGPDNTTVTLEAVISPIPLPGIVTNGDLQIEGNAVTIGGASGGVHSNGDMVISGSGDNLGGTVSISGAYDGPEDLGAIEGAAQLPVPQVRASDYRAHANFVLTSSGTMTDLAGNPACTVPGDPCENWDFADGAWSFGNQEPPDGTYYVEGDVSIRNSPTVTMTIIAEGSIDIGGNPTLTPQTPELLFVTDGDLKIQGLDAAADITVQGQMLVHGQVDFFGSVQLAGQLIVEDADAGDLVPTGGNNIRGSVTLTYNGTLGSAVYSVTGWRDLRQ